MLDEIIDGTIESAKEVGEVGKDVLTAGAGFIAPVAVIGVIAAGFSKMFDGFKK